MEMKLSPMDSKIDKLLQIGTGIKNDGSDDSDIDLDRSFGFFAKSKGPVSHIGSSTSKESVDFKVNTAKTDISTAESAMENAYNKAKMLPQLILRSKTSTTKPSAT